MKMGIHSFKKRWHSSCCNSSMMQSWLEYLSFLSWQNQKLNLTDFKKVFQHQENISSMEQLITFVSYPETKQYLKTRKDWWREVEKNKKECQSLGIKTTWPFHSDYPKELFKMEEPPLLISWKGETCWKNHFLLAVVGSRKPYQDTLVWMDIYLSAFLKKRKKICVISGGARGVDQKAHALCLASKNPTLCFLPCGIKHYYPMDLKKWETHILDTGGAFISVFPLSEIMRKSYFHKRNKVLAFLSHLILIAQAQLRSGTMVTAKYALHAGTNTAVLPGSPLYTGYKGNLSLINDGCFMVRDHLDIETLYHSSQSNITEFYKNIIKTDDLEETIKHDQPLPTRP